MKKIIVICLLVLAAVGLWGQTWTVEGDDNFDIEYTVITKEQWERIVKAHIATDEAVNVGYSDISEQVNVNVKKGTRPQISGYYYLIAKMVPKNEVSRMMNNYFTATVIYGNSDIGTMQLTFSSLVLPNMVSLKYDYDAFTKQYNQVIRLVNGE
jgi:hypothetical protein